MSRWTRKPGPVSFEALRASTDLTAEPPATGIEAALDEPSRTKFRIMKLYGLHGECDRELYPYYLDAEQFARHEIDMLAKVYGNGACNPVAAGFAVEASLARAAGKRAQQAGDTRLYLKCLDAALKWLAKAVELCTAAAEASPARPVWLEEEPEPVPEPEPIEARVEPGPFDPNPPKPAITIVSEDGTEEHPEPGPAPEPEPEPGSAPGFPGGLRGLFADDESEDP